MAAFSSCSHGSTGRRGGRGDGAKPRAKTQEELDYEMDLLAVERDGGDVEALKEAYKAKKEEARKAAAAKREEEKKAKLDSQMVRRRSFFEGLVFFQGLGFFEGLVFLRDVFPRSPVFLRRREIQSWSVDHVRILTKHAFCVWNTGLSSLLHCPHLLSTNYRTRTSRKKKLRREP